ncbi:phage holin family protein [Pseudocitrobacter corydidari]|uniref:Uncharacterized protein n=1 Tax=Pseudocitrobacter corydidari TaxID=2891570 RepID=A0ABY3S8N0_9ENTR|nr:phage holin family protein [Pseudocitrobacter corydidari]UGS42158.1 hypothetical protein G163CM_28830 [Pseudocitrobacter corydidari]
MTISNHLETSKVVLLEVEVFFTLVATGAWGGLVNYIIRKKTRTAKSAAEGIASCLKQMVVSCFTSFLLSAVAIEKGCSFNFVLLSAGLGGFFAGPILKLFGGLVKRFFKDFPFQVNRR